MAGGADFLVNLKAALQRRAVVRAERPFEGPAEMLRRKRACVDGRLRGCGDRKRGEGKSEPSKAHDRGPHSAGALTCSAPEPMTEVAMVAGRGFGDWSRPSSGGMRTESAS